MGGHSRLPRGVPGGIRQEATPPCCRLTDPGVSTTVIMARTAESRLRILAVTDLYPPASVGGMELRLSVILRALEERGHSFAVLTSRTNGAACPESPFVHRTLRSEQDDPFHGVGHVLWFMGRQIENILRLRGAISRHRPDIVYAWKLAELSQSLYLYLRALRLPVVLSFGDRWGFLSEDQWPLFHAGAGRPTSFASLKRRCYSRLASILSSTLYLPVAHNYPTSFLAGQFNTQALATYYERRGFHFTHTAVIRNGVDTTLFHPASREYRAGPISLIYFGRIARDKGVSDLLTLMASVPPRVATLTIVGDGPLLPAMKQEAIRNGLGHVRFLPFVPREALTGLLSQHDAYVLPQRPALDNLTIDSGTLEAAACGLALIVAESPGYREVFDTSQAAILCHEPERMAHAVHDLFEHPPRLRQLGERARHLVEREFTLERMVSETERFLLRVRDSA